MRREKHWNKWKIALEREWARGEMFSRQQYSESAWENKALWGKRVGFNLRHYSQTLERMGEQKGRARCCQSAVRNVSKLLPPAQYLICPIWTMPSLSALAQSSFFRGTLLPQQLTEHKTPSFSFPLVFLHKSRVDTEFIHLTCNSGLFVYSWVIIHFHD